MCFCVCVSQAILVTHAQIHFNCPQFGSVNKIRVTVRQCQLCLRKLSLCNVPICEIEMCVCECELVCVNFVYAVQIEDFYCLTGPHV